MIAKRYDDYFRDFFWNQSGLIVLAKIYHDYLFIPQTILQLS
jgi:hypothetical protein